MDTTLPDASGPSQTDMDTAALEASAAITTPRERVPVKVEGMLSPTRGYLRNDVAVPR